MFGQSFYHGTIRKYVILFGTLFNDIVIEKTDANGATVESIKVPLSYSPKEKMLARLNQDPNLDRKYAIQLPRMGFEMTSMTYSAARKLATINKRVKQNSTNANKLDYIYNPVPFDITFSLYVMVKNAEDGTRILEQILPFFTPEWTASVNLIPEMDIVMDIPVTLLNVTPQDTYEGGFTERRALIWTLDFILKGYLFGPVRRSGVIKLANVNFYDATSFNDIDDAVGQSEFVERIEIKPGLDANGDPTSNSSISIPYSQIKATDNYGYIVNIEGSENE